MPMWAAPGAHDGHAAGTRRAHGGTQWPGHVVGSQRTLLPRSGSALGISPRGHTPGPSKPLHRVWPAALSVTTIQNRLNAPQQDVLTVKSTHEISRQEKNLRHTAQ